MITVVVISIILSISFIGVFAASKVSLDMVEKYPEVNC